MASTASTTPGPASGGRAASRGARSHLCRMPLMHNNHNVEVTGQLLEDGVLARILNDAAEYGCDYTIDKIEIGKTAEDMSSARIKVTAPDEERLQRLLMRLQTHGANRVDPGQAVLETVVRDGV